MQSFSSWNRPLGYERVYVPLYKLAGTPFHIQGDEIFQSTSGEQRLVQYPPITYFQMYRGTVSCRWGHPTRRFLAGSLSTARIVVCQETWPSGYGRGVAGSVAGPACSSAGNSWESCSPVDRLWEIYALGLYTVDDVYVHTVQVILRYFFNESSKHEALAECWGNVGPSSSMYMTTCTV